MGILYGYVEPKDMLYKLMRDGRKAHFPATPEDMCDNIFNFCITGHSMRDWCIKYLGIDSDKEAKKKFHEKCNENEHLKYCRDIANASKHFGLSSDRTSTVSKVKSEQTSYGSFDLYGRRVEGSETQQQTAKVVLSDGKEIDLIMFLLGVFNGLQAIMDDYGIPYESSKAHPAYFVAQYQ